MYKLKYSSNILDKNTLGELGGCSLAENLINIKNLQFLNLGNIYIYIYINIEYRPK